MSEVLGLVGKAALSASCLPPTDGTGAGAVEGDLRVHRCAECGGDGGWDVPHGVDYHDGSLITSWRLCEACEGQGVVEIMLIAPDRDDDMEGAECL